MKGDGCTAGIRFCSLAVAEHAASVLAVWTSTQHWRQDLGSRANARGSADSSTRSWESSRVESAFYNDR